MLEATDDDAGLLIAPADDAPPLAEPSAGTGPATFTLRRAHPPEANIAPGDVMLVVRVFAADEDRDEFRRWLDEEHCRLQLGVPGVRWYLGYEEDGDRHSFLNLWGIDDPAVVHGEAWTQVRDTPWWHRVSRILQDADRGTFRVVRSATAE